MIRLFLASICFIITGATCCANEVDAASTPKAPMSVALPLLSTIEDNAIVIGHGSRIIYVFIDPMCIKSREFVNLISTDIKLQSQYTYKLFLYQLTKKFDSKGAIETIYESIESKETLLKFMALTNKQPVISAHTTDSNVSKKIQDIQDVASQLKIFKRPYIFVSAEEKSI